MGRNWDNVDLTDNALIADALSRQPLVRSAFSQLPQIARVPFLDTPHVGLGAVAGSLDRIAYNLLFVIKLNNNLLTRDQALAVAGDLDPHWLDRAAADLVVIGLATVLDTGELTLFDHIAERIGLPLPSFGDGVAHISSDRLQRAANRAGLGPVGTRKAERAEAMASLLCDADEVGRVLRSLSVQARQIFEALWHQTVDRVPSDATIEGAHPTYSFLPVELRYLGASRMSEPIRELTESLLIGSDWHGYEVWIWAETAAAFGMSMTPPWTPPALPDAVALGPAGPDAIVDALHALEGVIAATTATPAQGNKTGARRPPVKYWRSVAKAAGLDSELTVRCGNLAIELGLLVPELGAATGRGRNATRDCFWVPEPERLAAFEAQPAIRRWAALVERWLTPRLEPDDSAAQVRLIVLSVLDHLPDGFGIPAADLSNHLAVRHSRFASGEPLDDDLADLIRLGVVSSGTALGLTPAGRALCHSLDSLDELFGDSTSAVPAVIQADHTIITSPGTSLDTIIGLRRIADPVSSGAVGVWRLSADRIARSAAGGTFDPIAFMGSLSDSELPPGVERFLSDSIGTASTVTIRPVGCVITSPDHAVLSDAARHKAAKLEVVAPGVAVFPLAEAKVAEVLRGKGVLLAGSRLSGAAAPKPAPAWVIDHVESDEPIPALSPLLFGPDDAGTAEALAVAMADRHRNDGSDDRGDRR